MATCWTQTFRFAILSRTARDRPTWSRRLLWTFCSSASLRKSPKLPIDELSSSHPVARLKLSLERRNPACVGTSLTDRSEDKGRSAPASRRPSSRDVHARFYRTPTRDTSESLDLRTMKSEKWLITATYNLSASIKHSLSHKTKPVSVI